MCVCACFHSVHSAYSLIPWCPSPPNHWSVFMHAMRVAYSIASLFDLHNAFNWSFGWKLFTYYQIGKFTSRVHVFVHWKAHFQWNWHTMTMLFNISKGNSSNVDDLALFMSLAIHQTIIYIWCDAFLYICSQVVFVQWFANFAWLLA